MALRYRLVAPAIALLLCAPALAHTLTYHAVLDGHQVVNEDGTMGSGSSATGHLEMMADEHELVFDILEFHVMGIDPADLDLSHGPNASAIHVHMGEGGGGHHTKHDPIVIDLGWYVSAGFGTLTPTATGFSITLSGILTEVQGAYDMTGSTGMSPEDVMHAMEDGGCYVQVHTVDHPHGAIRGQLLPEGVANDSGSFGELKAKF